MTITLSNDLERRVTDRARNLGVTPEELVHKAIDFYFQPDEELQRELDDWQRMTWHAWATVEDSLP